MSTRILKVAIKPFDAHLSRISKPGRVIHVGWQGDNVCAWIETDPEQPTMPLILMGAATGQTVDEPWQYVGTAQSPDKPLVIHVFQQRVEPAPEFFAADVLSCPGCTTPRPAPPPRPAPLPNPVHPAP